MRVVVAGGHGKIALRLERQLAGRRDAVVGLIRDPDQAADLRQVGAEPVLIDLERATPEAVAGHLAGADAVVFAAGAGPGSGAARKETMDRDGAILLADAARIAGVRRYLLVSALGVTDTPAASAGEVFAAYLRAKWEADEELRRRPDLDLTILRPGGLTDEPGIGRVELAEHFDWPGVDSSISRDDVAWVLAALLNEPETAGLTLELRAGGLPIAQAVAAAARGLTPPRLPDSP